MGQTSSAELIQNLKVRFINNPSRHPRLDWSTVYDRLTANDAALRTLLRMEETGGEPDVIGVDAASGQVIFCDCSPESPAGRRSLCFDRAALDARKENKPAGCATERAAEIGITLLNEDEYRALQALGQFDRKTSSWIQTPDRIRKLGGALFCDRRYDTVFTYHNGADSYYAARGFRGRLLV